jgi:pyridoxine 5-phosphate synthase
MGIRLSVNIDHVATLRQVRRARDPEPVAAAILAELAGACGITVHIRGDRRHIQERDIYLLRESMRGKLNIEAACTPDALKVMNAVRPDQVTLVPEREEELTTEGGLDLKGQQEQVAEYIALYKEAGIPVSLFINPDAETVRIAGKLGVKVVEFNTLAFGAATTPEAVEAETRRLADMAKAAARLKIEVHVGHDINYQNAHLIRGIDGIEEASIGHAIVARAVLVGMDRAVREMMSALNGGG